MSSVTVNFHGDFHFALPANSIAALPQGTGNPRPAEKSPGNGTCSGSYEALVKSIGDFLQNVSDEAEEYANGASDGDIDSIVAVMRPGKAPEVMTESECYEEVERRGNFSGNLVINDPDVCAYDLKAVYDPRTVIALGEQKYVIGPVIVYAVDEDGDGISLSAGEVMAAIVYFYSHTKLLCADGKDFPAFVMEKEQK